ncbi:Nse4 C-terminal-domain-containing protein [Gaertneriomyces semiglobifer]|nr:Nse4 C-terminal-domain-containing protein [Gaertneriomyces semiglobifer]
MSESESDTETSEALRRIKRERTRRRTHSQDDDDNDEEDEEEKQDIDSDENDENDENDEKDDNDYDDAEYDSDGNPVRYERDLATQPTPLQTRRLRSQYRALLSSAADTSSLSEHDLISTLHAANKLYRKVKTTQEATLDSRVLVMAADAGVRRVERMRVDGGIFGVEDWLNRVKKALTVGPTTNTPPPTSTTTRNNEDDEETMLDWYTLGPLATRLLKRAPTIGFMLGPLALEHRPRPSTRRVARLIKDSTALQHPALLTHSDLASRPETSSLVQTIYTALLTYTTTHPSTPLPLFKFFINPNSFSQSVENMFYTSFLIRDGRAQVVVEEDGELVIEPAAAVQDGDETAGRRQCLMDLDMEVWKRLVEVYRIEESVIPMRQKVVQEAGRWYG